MIFLPFTATVFVVLSSSLMKAQERIFVPPFYELDAATESIEHGLNYLFPKGFPDPIICRADRAQVNVICELIYQPLADYLVNIPSPPKDFLIKNRNDTKPNSTNEIASCDDIEFHYYHYKEALNPVVNTRAFRCPGKILPTVLIHPFHIMSLGDSTTRIYVLSGGTKGLFSYGMPYYYLFAQLWCDCPIPPP